MKLLTWRGVLAQEEGSIHLAHCDCDGDSDDARTIRPLEATACAYRFAFGPMPPRFAYQKVRANGHFLSNDSRIRRSAMGRFAKFAVMGSGR